MIRCVTVLPALCVGLLLGMHRKAATGRADEPNKIIAINVALDPDKTMVDRAKAANARLLKAYREGYSLDDTHRPHITCLQCFVREADLDKVYPAIAKMLAEKKPALPKLKAIKYYYLPSGDRGLAGIVIEPAEELIRFQENVIDAVAPFTVKTGDKTAFFTTKEEPDIDPLLIGYVRGYVAKASGKWFNPHVTVGLAKKDYLDAMLKEKFEEFEFSPTGLSVYQLGNFGTARKQLKQWQLKG